MSDGKENTFELITMLNEIEWRYKEKLICPELNETK